jgi:hypothetical protein
MHRNPHHTKVDAIAGRTAESQAEVDRRVEIYARQVEATGRIMYEPRPSDSEDLGAQAEIFERLGRMPVDSGGRGK